MSQPVEETTDDEYAKLYNDDSDGEEEAKAARHYSTLEGDLASEAPTEATITLREMNEVIRRMGAEQDTRLKALSVVIQMGITDPTEVVEVARDIEQYLING
jgi:hypothetical protein